MPTSAKKKTLVYETSLDGHRRHYLAVIDDVLASECRELTYYLPEQGEISLKHGKILQKISPHSSKGLGSAISRLRYLVKAILSCRPNIVLIPTSDGLSQLVFLLAPLLLFLQCRIVCVLHRSKFGYPAPSLRDRLIQLYSYITYGIAFRCSFLSVDIVPVEALKKRANPLRLRINYLPDPLKNAAYVPKGEAREITNLPKDLQIFGCVGVIDRRKGADLLIKAAPHLNADQRILLAGKFHPEINAILADLGEETKSKLILENRFLGEDEMFAYICALDGMLMIQHGHTGISSFALHSVKYGIPLLCSSTPWFNELKKQFPEIVTIAEDGENLGSLITDWGSNCQRGHTPDEAFSQKYSRTAFADALANELK